MFDVDAQEVIKLINKTEAIKETTLKDKDFKLKVFIILKYTYFNLKIQVLTKKQGISSESYTQYAFNFYKLFTEKLMFIVRKLR
ncbi:MAG: hypothetical protein K6G52_06350 [Treponemataceae bacterium]|nr:hypothetical protein [Treponemataceae bacterium]